MSTIAAGTTTTTALVSTGNTDGTIQLQVNGTTPSVTLNTLGAIGVGSSPSYGTSGQVLASTGSTSAPAWTSQSALAAGSVVTTNFSIVESGGKLYFKYGATNLASLDSSGNLIVLANITAYGTP